ncbi:MAG: hypothetical protein FJX53_12630 [Alphaproteobacteria bacterium]|nr:hypothetical protein [Alphaproteobacteria bacterium]
MIHGIAENFAKYVAEGIKVQVTIDIKPASQIFNLRTSAEALQLGTLDPCWTDLGTHANWQPQFGCTALPFLFSGYNHVKKVSTGRSASRSSPISRRPPAPRSSPSAR